jgi:hypothetical protein
MSVLAAAFRPSYGSFTTALIKPSDSNSKNRLSLLAGQTSHTRSSSPDLYNASRAFAFCICRDGGVTLARSFNTLPGFNVWPHSTELILVKPFESLQDVPDCG